MPASHFLMSDVWMYVWNCFPVPWLKNGNGKTPPNLLIMPLNPSLPISQSLVAHLVPKGHDVDHKH